MTAARSLLKIVAIGLMFSSGRVWSQEVRLNVPAKVEAVLRTIDETGHAPRGYIGGRPYENHARRGEQPLPRVDRDGDPITYLTWDVNPEIPGRSRGAERLVTGSDGSAYYTPDDYKVFATVRNPSRSHHGGSDHPREEPSRPAAKSRNVDLPVVELDPRTAAKVNPVLAYVLAHGEPMPDYVGGR
jgi:hypothetical protein